jgi:hypothetical protein
MGSSSARLDRRSIHGKNISIGTRQSDYERCDLEGEYDDLYTSVISLVTYCEENDKRLTDILEKVYLELKEESNEVSR